MTELLEQRLNCREEVSHFAVDERKLLERRLLRADLGVHAH